VELKSSKREGERNEVGSERIVHMEGCTPAGHHFTASLFVAT